MKKEITYNITSLAHKIQECAIALRDKYYQDPQLGYDYNWGGIRTGLPLHDLQADEQSIAAMSKGAIKLQLCSHRHIIIYICPDGEDISDIVHDTTGQYIKPINLKAANEYGTYMAPNTADTSANNPYVHIAQSIINNISKLTSYQKNKLMRQIESSDCASDLKQMATAIQDYAVAALAHVTTDRQSYSDECQKLREYTSRISNGDVIMDMATTVAGKIQLRFMCDSKVMTNSVFGARWNGRVSVNNVSDKILEAYAKLDAKSSTESSVAHDTTAPATLVTQAASASIEPADTQTVLAAVDCNVHEHDNKIAETVNMLHINLSAIRAQPSLQSCIPALADYISAVLFAATDGMLTCSLSPSGAIDVVSRNGCHKTISLSASVEEIIDVLRDLIIQTKVLALSARLSDISDIDRLFAA